MRDFGTDINEHLSALQGVAPRHLVWVESQNRSTGETEPSGFWDGGVSRTFEVEGTPRHYFAAGSLLKVGSIRGGVGLRVRMHELSLSDVSVDVQEAIEKYDARLAPIEIHRVYFSPERGVAIGDPVRILKGWIDEVINPRAPDGETATVTFRVADSVRGLTRTLTQKKSDAAQRLVDPDDRGREYATISGAVDVFWGRREKLS